jgi:hypothetical protein
MGQVIWKALWTMRGNERAGVDRFSARTMTVDLHSPSEFITLSQLLHPFDFNTSHINSSASPALILDNIHQQHGVRPRTGISAAPKSGPGCGEYQVVLLRFYEQSMAYDTLPSINESKIGSQSSSCRLCAAAPSKPPSKGWVHGH